MKKLLLLIVVVLALFTIDHPIIKNPRDKLFGQTMSGLADAGKVNSNNRAKAVIEKLSTVMTLTSKEQQYVNSELSTNKKVQKFEQVYCKKKEINPVFYGEKLRQVCRLISTVN